MANAFSHNIPSSISECDYAFTYPADIGILTTLRNEMLSLKDIKHFQNEIIDSLLIIITELITNAIKHGSKDLQHAHIRLGLLFRMPFIVCIIEDNGPGFDRTMIPDPTLPEFIHREHGRGIFISEHLAKHIEYTYSNNTMRIIVTLEQH
ncbi:MAG: ATP-binding protein [Bacteroidetes bacterium]|nr:ATP-binding protein [bacterium]NBP64465.1 ATP-binding protein [Bacteroidota bacterium]